MFSTVKRWWNRDRLRRLLLGLTLPCCRGSLLPPHASWRRHSCTKHTRGQDRLQKHTRLMLPNISALLRVYPDDEAKMTHINLTHTSTGSVLAPVALMGPNLCLCENTLIPKAQRHIYKRAVTLGFFGWTSLTACRVGGVSVWASVSLNKGAQSQWQHSSCHRPCSLLL